MQKLLRFLRRGLKWCGIALGGLVLLALFLFALAWATNRGDEPLTPEAQALRQPPQNPYRSEDNIYLALLGFEAPPGESPIALGQARVERYNSKVDAALRDPTFKGMQSLLSTDEPRSLRFRGKLECKGPAWSCWREVPAHRANIEKLLADNHELYDRYRALQHLRGYFETARPSVLAPITVAPQEVRGLFQVDVALRLHSDDPVVRQAALAALRDDLQLWRTVLTARRSLISTMIALGFLHSDELLLADIIADPGSSIPLGADDAQAVTPLFALDDWNIATVFRAEFRVHESILEQVRYVSERGWIPPDLGPWERLAAYLNNHLTGRFLRFNATENLYAQQLSREMRAAAPGAEAPAPENPWTSLAFVYNPIGKVLVALSEGAYANYPARAWDEAAFQRLLRLSYEIRRQQVAAASIPAFLSSHPELATHPSSRQPLVWDAQARTIRVPNVAPQSSGRPFYVHVWPETGAHASSGPADQP
jgi:hypothetical protein